MSSSLADLRLDNLSNALLKTEQVTVFLVREELSNVLGKLEDVFVVGASLASCLSNLACH